MHGPPSKLQLPGILMIVMGIAGSLLSGAGILSTIMNAFQGITPGEAGYEAGQYIGLGIGGIFAVMGVLVGGLVSLGGWSLFKGRRRMLVMVSAIALCIPCYWSCCGFSIPLGIWVLVLINQPDAFRHFDNDPY